MADELAVYEGRAELATSDEARLAIAGQVANGVAANGAVADYLSRKAANTVRTQAAALSMFADFLDKAGALGGAMRVYAGAVASWANEEEAHERPDPGAWRGVTWGIVEAFVKWLLAAGFSVGTVNNRLSALKVHARLANKAGALTVEELAMIRNVSGYSDKEAKRIDECRDVTRVGDKKAEHTSLTAEQAQTLKDWRTYEGPQGARDCLLMNLLLDHGLRVSEVAGLQVANIDLQAGELQFYRPKVDKWQRHRLTADTMRAVYAYLQHGPAIGPLLWGSTKGGALTEAPMSTRAISKRVRYLGDKLLAIDNLSPHDCRHYWATDAARNGTDPFRLQEAGGWASLTMPRRYVEDAVIANDGVKLS